MAAISAAWLRPSSGVGRTESLFVCRYVDAGCVAGLFTYMGQDALGVDLTVRAHASTGLPAAVTDPVVSRYNYAATGGYPSLAE